MREWEIGAVENIHGALPYIRVAPILALAACRTEVRENGCGRIAMWRGHGIERLS